MTDAGDRSRRASTTEGLPVAPSLGPVLDEVNAPREIAAVSPRVVVLCGYSVVIAFAAGLVARGLTALIGLITNLSFYGRFSSAFVSPADNHLGAWVIAVPIAGGLIVGLMARYGSKAIRGHGIPEAMEQVLLNRSRIAPRVLLLKPLSAAIAIGTGGPFGAEGPIIATGGALGSLLGQLLHTTADERKTLLAAGAAAGMAATFGSPVSAVLLAVELLLFEFRPRSLLPVALACATATGVRYAFLGDAPAFLIPDLAQPSGAALATYVAIGALVGVASAWVTRAVYYVEDLFEHLPVHWMWWPAIGAALVGLVGFFAPRTLGVGYTNIEEIVGGSLVGTGMMIFCALKFLSWSVALGSGTSGGTLAPLFTIGAGLGSALGALCVSLAPALGVDLRVAALVGMAAIFAGASRALLTSVVFAFETTRQPLGLLPLIGGCTASFLSSSLLLRNSIMTEKIVRRGTRVPSEYAADFLSLVSVQEAASPSLVTLGAEDTLDAVRAFIASHAPGTSHQGFPVVEAGGRLLGVLTRRDLLDPERPGSARLRGLLRRPAVVVFPDSSLREAADHMVREGVGRLAVVSRAEPSKAIAMLTRSDLLAAHGRRLDESGRAERSLRLFGPSVDPGRAAR